LIWKDKLNLALSVPVNKMGQALFSLPEARQHGTAGPVATILTQIALPPPHTPTPKIPASRE